MYISCIHAYALNNNYYHINNNDNMYMPVLRPEVLSLARELLRLSLRSSLLLLLLLLYSCRLSLVDKYARGTDFIAILLSGQRSSVWRAIHTILYCVVLLTLLKLSYIVLYHMIVYYIRMYHIILYHIIV